MCMSLCDRLLGLVCVDNIYNFYDQTHDYFLKTTWQIYYASKYFSVSSDMGYQNR